MNNELEKLIIEMKDTSEVMVDLAYSALLYNNKEIAKEVSKLEEVADKLHDEIHKRAISHAVEDRNILKALVLIRLAGCMEVVADSAVEIADVVLRGIEPHPVVELSIMDSDAIITKAEIAENSVLIGKTLGETKLASRTGMWTIAIKKGDRLIVRPDENTVIEKGDIVFTRGPIESEKDFIKIASGKKRKI